MVSQAVSQAVNTSLRPSERLPIFWRQPLTTCPGPKISVQCTQGRTGKPSKCRSAWTQMEQLCKNEIYLWCGKAANSRGWLTARLLVIVIFPKLYEFKTNVDNWYSGLAEVSRRAWHGRSPSLARRPRLARPPRKKVLGKLGALHSCRPPGANSSAEQLAKRVGKPSKRRSEIRSFLQSFFLEQMFNPSETNRYIRRKLLILSWKMFAFFQYQVVCD